MASSSPSRLPGPIRGALSGVPGRTPAKRVDQLQLGDLGERAVGLSQQLVNAARGHLDVEATLLHGRPDDHPAIRRGTT